MSSKHIPAQPPSCCQGWGQHDITCTAGLYGKPKGYAAAPVPAQVKPATCCNRHSDADIAFNKEMHAWVPDIMTYPNPMGRCLCGYGRLYKMSFTEWELHVQGDPRVKQQSAPVPAQGTPPAQPEPTLVAKMRTFAEECLRRIAANPHTDGDELHTKDTYQDILKLCDRCAPAPAPPQVAGTLEQEWREVARLAHEEWKLCFVAPPIEQAFASAFEKFIRTKLRAALAESEPCGHLRANVFGDDYGHPYCLVCEALKRARAEALEEAANFVKDWSSWWTEGELPEVAKKLAANLYPHIRNLAAQPTPAPKEQK